MNLQIAHIGDLNKMYFNIPNYQRGYRWETKQVYDLLDDLLEFSFQPHPDGAFYCLQPLVVVKNNILSMDGKKVFDVIDGQQRLTTIFLIFKEITNIPIYHLRYERASSQENSTDYEDGEITADKLNHLTTDEIKNNPDYFYLSKAIEDIKEWFKKKENEYSLIKDIIKEVIYYRLFKTPQKPIYQRSDNDKDENEALKDVRCIWYDATDPEIDYNNSIAVFKRLNYGKTSLTAAELIKALLFQCDVYQEVSRNERRQVAFRMSTQWDYMEKALQNRFMWSMIASKDETRISHINFILSHVAVQLAKDFQLNIITSKDSADYDYIVFNKYLIEQLKSKKYEDIVEDLWERIQDVFDILMSWFQDRELYHLIGLLLTLQNEKNKKKNTNNNGTLNSLINSYQDKTRSKFISLLKRKIFETIDVSKVAPKKGEPSLTLDNLAYGGNHDELIVKILLVYNVTLTLRDSQDNAYFPFWFYKNIIPSLEHIHPQHLHDDGIDFLTRCNWYDEKCENIKLLIIPEKKKREIDDAMKTLYNVLHLTEGEKNPKNNEDKKSFQKKKENYEQDISNYREMLKKIDAYFDELADIDQRELHNIRNMALVDVATNAALGNNLMAFKRQKLMERQADFNKSNGKNGAYIFEGTWKVFNKQFWKADTDEKERVNASNLLFWTKADRKNYFNELKAIYEEYENEQ